MSTQSFKSGLIISLFITNESDNKQRKGTSGF